MPLLSQATTVPPLFLLPCLSMSLPSTLSVSPRHIPLLPFVCVSLFLRPSLSVCLISCFPPCFLVPSSLPLSLYYILLTFLLISSVLDIVTCPALTFAFPISPHSSTSFIAPSPSSPILFHTTTLLYLPLSFTYFSPSPYMSLPSPPFQLSFKFTT